MSCPKTSSQSSSRGPSDVFPRALERLAAFEFLSGQHVLLSGCSDAPRARPAVISPTHLARLATDRFQRPSARSLDRAALVVKTLGVLQNLLASFPEAGRVVFILKYSPNLAPLVTRRPLFFHSQPIASYSASMTGPSHSQGGAGTT